MLGYRALQIQKSLRMFDDKLFLNLNLKGELQIMRKSFKRVPYEVEGKIILNLEPNHHYICSLTQDFTSRTSPVDWGVLPILDHLRAIDCHNRESFVNKMEEYNQKHEAGKRKDFNNQTEAFCYEFRDSFKKATSDINTSNLEKIDSRRKRERKWQS